MSAMSDLSKRRTGAGTARADSPPPACGARGFSDRHDAGRRLATLLERFRAERPVVVGIPRGGVPVAAEVARSLDAPLDVAVVCKIGAPRNPEFAIGALAEGGVHLLSERALRMLGLSDAGLRVLVADVEAELDERQRCYRGARSAPGLAGRTVLLVDDGLATGRSAQAAVRSLRGRGAARVILAVPVASREALAALRGEVEEAVCVQVPADLRAVGHWYEDFSPTTDEEVRSSLARSRPHEQV
jgi:putative phosphoribosyl transferase